MSQKKAAGPAYPRFTSQMKSTHKLLIPAMAPIHFRLIVDAIRQDGYDIEVLKNTGPEVVRQGLQYVHNDACYPALLVIGQFIDALKSGAYDIERTALIITQTGGGCRASNYIHLLRKALVKAGFSNVPVASINFSGLERDSGFSLSLTMIRKAFAACLYGDMLMALSNQIKPYEHTPGQTMGLVATWENEIEARFQMGHGVSKRDMQSIFDEIAEDFSHIPFTRTPKVKVGIVGEIYVKYSPLGNNNLEDFLAGEDCEVCVPGLLAFVQYCVASAAQNSRLYGGNAFTRWIYDKVLALTYERERGMLDAIARHKNLRPPARFEDTMELAKGFISLGAKMGEGWLLTGEMVELVKSGFSNIVCAQPFGCLPNHVVGKGMISKIRAVYPEANITPIDYDPGATRVNQENRIKLMLASAKEIQRRQEHAMNAAKQTAAQVPPEFVIRLNEGLREKKVGVRFRRLL